MLAGGSKDASKNVDSFDSAGALDTGKSLHACARGDNGVGFIDIVMRMDRYRNV